MKFEKTDYCVPVSVSLPVSVINHIDLVRKDIGLSRSSFVKNIVLESIKLSEGMNNDN